MCNQVKKTTHVKPGKGGAFVQVGNCLVLGDVHRAHNFPLLQAELKEIGGNRNKNQRFRSTEDVTAAELDSYQFYTLLYMDGDNMVLMHEETFEQREIPGSMLGGAAPFLSDGMRMRVEFYNGEPLQVKPPAAADFTVAEAQSVRSDTVNPTSFKSVTLHNGQRLMVPPFVNEGDIVSVNMDTLEYAERVKKA